VINQLAQHFTMILTLIFSSGQVSVQNVPGFNSYATCSLAGEQVIMRTRNQGNDATYQCVVQ
jgi:hypothetical protein